MKLQTARVMITGANGLLGQAVARYFTPRAKETLALNRATLDITDISAVNQQMATFRPTLVINCAAMARVDACETQPELAAAVNITGVANLAQASRQFNFWLMHISTDYVFAGNKQQPYTIKDAPQPISIYGQTKYTGEQAVIKATPQHYIVRVARLFGPGGQNFGSRIFDQLQQAVTANQLLKVCDYPISQATYLPDLVAQLSVIAEQEVAGIYHITNSGPATSWWQFTLDAAAILHQATNRPEFHPQAIVNLMQLVDYPDIGLLAPRPRYSALACLQSEQLQLPILRDWRQALATMLT
jgi:dTDP-4-dehydrorhamnose reductase